MIEVGLTGGIASGKSVVSCMLAGLGARVVDADVLARQALEPGRPAFAETVLRFGEGILSPDGTVDRARLAELVFSDPDKRLLLESIVHPAVFELEAELVRRVAEEEPGSVVVFDAALLIESGAHSRMDKVVVVWCRPGTQLERLMRRNGMTAEEALRRVDAQMPLEEKLGYADYVIDNDGSIEDTLRQVKEVYAALKQYV